MNAESAAPLAGVSNPVRRQTGGYAWRDELDQMKRIGERMTAELVELGKHTQSVGAANQVTRLVALSSQISVKAMELREYKG